MHGKRPIPKLRNRPFLFLRGDVYGAGEIGHTKKAGTEQYADDFAIQKLLKLRGRGSRICV
jgi:hypothetical protein